MMVRKNLCIFFSAGKMGAGNHCFRSRSKEKLLSEIFLYIRNDV